MNVSCDAGLHNFKESGRVIVHSPDSIEVMTERRCNRCGAYERDSDVGRPDHPEVRAAAKKLGWKPRETLQLALLDEWGDKLHAWDMADIDTALEAIHGLLESGFMKSSE